MKQKSIEILQDNLDGLVRKYDVLVKDDKFNESLNVIKNIESTIKQLVYLNVPIINNEEDSEFLDWYSVLKLFIETKQSQLINLDCSSIDAQIKHRGTGKTTALLQLANDYDIPIYCNGHIGTIQILKDKAKCLNIRPTIIDNKRDFNLVQLKNQEIILVDENTYLDDLPKDKIIIGFTNRK